MNKDGTPGPGGAQNWAVDASGGWIYSSDPPHEWQGWHVVLHWYLVDGVPEPVGLNVRSYELGGDAGDDVDAHHDQGHVASRAPTVSRKLTQELPLGRFIREDRPRLMASLAESAAADGDPFWEEIAQLAKRPRRPSGPPDRDELLREVAAAYTEAHKRQASTVAQGTQALLDLRGLLPSVPDEFPDEETERKFFTTRRVRVRTLIGQARKQADRLGYTMPPPTNRKGSQ